jgi:hypothetical protein
MSGINNYSMRSLTFKILLERLYHQKAGTYLRTLMISQISTRAKPGPDLTFTELSTMNRLDHHQALNAKDQPSLQLTNNAVNVDHELCSPPV